MSIVLFGASKWVRQLHQVWYSCPYYLSVVCNLCIAVITRPARGTAKPLRVLSAPAGSVIRHTKFSYGINRSNTVRDPVQEATKAFSVLFYAHWVCYFQCFRCRYNRSTNYWACINGQKVHFPASWCQFWPACYICYIFWSILGLWLLYKKVFRVMPYNKQHQFAAFGCRTLASSRRCAGR